MQQFTYTPDLETESVVTFEPERFAFAPLESTIPQGVTLPEYRRSRPQPRPPVRVRLARGLAVWR